jgi:hypothetical protein
MWKNISFLIYNFLDVEMWNILSLSSGNKNRLGRRQLLDV